MSSTQAAVCLGHLGQGTSGQGQPRDPGGDHEQTGGSTRGSEEEQESAQLWKVMGSDLGHPRAAKEICFDKPVLTEFALPANSQPLAQRSAEIYFQHADPFPPHPMLQVGVDPEVLESVISHLTLPRRQDRVTERKTVASRPQGTPIW